MSFASDDHRRFHDLLGEVEVILRAERAAWSGSRDGLTRCALDDALAALSLWRRLIALPDAVEATRAVVSALPGADAQSVAAMLTKKTVHRPAPAWRKPAAAVRCEILARLKPAFETLLSLAERLPS